jgi:hypothetical protein
MPLLTELQKAIEVSWAADTAFVADKWSIENPARGQCVATALVVQYYFGGELQKLATVFEGRPETHYRNIMSDGSVIDLTRSQYPAAQELIPAEVNLKGAASIREKRLRDPVTKQKYQLLQDRVASALVNSY